MTELWERGDASQWFHHWSQYESAVQWRATSEKKSGTKLAEFDEFYRNVVPGRIRSRDPPYLTKEELLGVVDWKHTRGQFRPNRRHVAGIPEATVENVTRAAFQALGNEGHEDGLAAAMALLSGKEMKGVGPATAAAILAVYDESVPFLSDEALAAVVPDRWANESSRYTASTVKEFTRRLRDKSQQLLTSLGAKLSAAGAVSGDTTTAGEAPMPTPASSTGSKRKKGTAVVPIAGEGSGKADIPAQALTPCQLERALWVADVFSDRPTKKGAPVRGAPVADEKVAESKGKGSKRKK